MVRPTVMTDVQSDSQRALRAWLVRMSSHVPPSSMARLMRPANGRRKKRAKTAASKATVMLLVRSSVFPFTIPPAILRPGPCESELREDRLARIRAQERDERRRDIRMLALGNNRDRV